VLLFRRDLAVGAGQTADVRAPLIRVDIREGPVVQAVTAVAEPVVVCFVGPGDESVEGHGHVKNGC
jgi:hypothetical protein